MTSQNIDSPHEEIEQFSYERYMEDGFQFEIDINKYLSEMTPLHSSYHSVFYYDSQNPKSKYEALFSVDFLNLLRKGIILPFDWFSIYKSISQYSFLDKLFNTSIFPGYVNDVDVHFLLRKNFKSILDIKQVKVILKGSHLETTDNQKYQKEWTSPILMAFDNDFNITSTVITHKSVIKDTHDTIVDSSTFEMKFLNTESIPEHIVAAHIRNPSSRHYFSQNSFPIDTNSDPKKIWDLIQMNRI